MNSLISIDSVNEPAAGKVSLLTYLEVMVSRQTGQKWVALTQDEGWQEGGSIRPAETSETVGCWVQPKGRFRGVLTHDLLHSKSGVSRVDHAGALPL